MKNKRFEYLDYKDVVKDNQTNKEYHTWYEDNLLDLLNSLSEENEELKSKLFDCFLELEHSKESVDDAYYELTQLKKENEKLKQQVAHHARMHEWFRNEAYLLQNKLDNREDEIRRLNGDME